MHRLVVGPRQARVTTENHRHDVGGSCQAPDATAIGSVEQVDRISAAYGDLLKADPNSDKARAVIGAPERVAYEDLARALSDKGGSEPPSVLKAIFHEHPGSAALLAAWLEFFREQGPRFRAPTN